MGNSWRDNPFDKEPFAIRSATKVLKPGARDSKIKGSLDEAMGNLPKKKAGKPRKKK